MLPQTAAGATPTGLLAGPVLLTAPVPLMIAVGITMSEV
jgi:hypothetical protein